MNVFLSIKYRPDFQNRAQIEAILKILQRCGARTCCVFADLEKWGSVHFELPELMRATLREIRTAHLVVIDLTEKGVGLGIEAGYAVARGIPVITIARSGSEISPTLCGISEDIFYYDGETDLETFFQHKLAIR